MVYTQLVIAKRKAGITPEYFRMRYEQHMAMVSRLVGSDTMPLRHTRRYVTTDSRVGTPLDYDVVVDMTFADEAAWTRFVAALSAPAVARAVADDEAAFWDRNRMTVAVVDELRETVQTVALA